MMFWSIEDDAKEVIEKVHPLLLSAIFDIGFWLRNRGEHLHITSTYRPRNDGMSKTSVHSTGRGVDFRVRGIDPEVVDEMEAYFNNKYRDIAAINSNGERVFLLVHNSGFGTHAHAQINYAFAREDA